MLARVMRANARLAPARPCGSARKPKKHPTDKIRPMSSRPPLAFAADPEMLLARARTTFDIEAAAVLGLKTRVGTSFVEAVHKILGVRGRVVVMGKSLRLKL